LQLAVTHEQHNLSMEILVHVTQDCDAAIRSVQQLNTSERMGLVFRFGHALLDPHADGNGGFDASVDGRGAAQANCPVSPAKRRNVFIPFAPALCFFFLPLMHGYQSTA
jgi:hypothetical protein